MPIQPAATLIFSVDSGLMLALTYQASILARLRAGEWEEMRWMVQKVA